MQQNYFQGYGIAINILTNDKVFKAGLRRKMRKAAMDRNYLASVLREFVFGGFLFGGGGGGVFGRGGVWVGCT